MNQYSNLYREYNSKNFDYYKITDETLYRISRETICLLCKLDYNDKEIEGRYKAGFYFIKCKQYKIKITA